MTKWILAIFYQTLLIVLTLQCLCVHVTNTNALPNKKSGAIHITYLLLCSKNIKFSIFPDNECHFLSICLLWLNTSSPFRFTFTENVPYALFRDAYDGFQNVNNYTCKCSFTEPTYQA